MTKQTVWEKYVSPYIRQRDASESGQVRCISCPTVAHWKEFDAGHFIPKSKGIAVYFEEDNLWPQCRKCNRFGSMDTGHRFGEAVKAKIGEERFARLTELKNKVSSPSEAKQILAQAEAYYKEKLALLTSG